MPIKPFSEKRYAPFLGTTGGNTSERHGTSVISPDARILLDRLSYPAILSRDEVLKTLNNKDSPDENGESITD